MSTVFNRPIISTKFTVLSQSRNLHKATRVCTKRLDDSTELGCRRSVFSVGRIENRNIMKCFNGKRPSMSEEGVQAFEQESSPLNFEATVNSLSKRLMGVLYGAIILLRHDGEAMWTLMGAALNYILSIELKKILNDERPVPGLKSNPGMPSSHAQCIFYIVAYLNAPLVAGFGINGFTATLSGLLFLLGSYFTWLRVSQKLHTIRQVIVGALIGSMFSDFWFWSWNAFVLNLFVSSLFIRISVVVGAIGLLISSLIINSWVFIGMEIQDHMLYFVGTSSISSTSVTLQSVLVCFLSSKVDFCKSRGSGASN